MTETLIKIENLHKSFGKNEVLKGINLEIKRGEVVVIIGPRGGGEIVTLASLYEFVGRSNQGEGYL